ncbi:MAG: preQ(1) synthase [Candidatus Methylomirabilia bacterium]
MFEAEGRRFAFADGSQIRPDFLQTFPFDSPEQYIKTETREFSAVCPFSGLPDLALVRIEYHPAGGRCVELKSLKYYLISFRNVGVFQEAATRRIFDDLRQALGTTRLRVTTIYNTRGGFDTTCVEGSLEPARARRTTRTTP